MEHSARAGQAVGIGSQAVTPIPTVVSDSAENVVGMVGSVRNVFKLFSYIENAYRDYQCA